MKHENMTHRLLRGKFMKLLCKLNKILANIGMPEGPNISHIRFDPQKKNVMHKSDPNIIIILCVSLEYGSILE